MSSYGLKITMRTLTLATVGIVAFGVDAVSEFAHTSLARGQEMEEGAQKLVERYQENARIQARAAAASRNDLAQQTSATLDENVNALWRVIVVPGTGQKAVKQPTNKIQPAVEGEHSDGDSSTSAKKE